MATTELVDADGGWISDESDFIGSEATKANLERRARRRLEMPYNPFAKSIKVATEPTAKKIKIEHGATPNKNDDAVKFLKSRPQVAAVQKSAASDRKTTNIETDRTKNVEDATDLLQSNRFNGDPAAWQQNETINDFLKRLPVAEPDTASVGPWLWVRSPQIGRDQKKVEERQDVQAFMELGEGLLDTFVKQRSKIDEQNPDKPPATITRKLVSNINRSNFQLVSKSLYVLLSKTDANRASVHRRDRIEIS